MPKNSCVCPKVPSKSDFLGKAGGSAVHYPQPNPQRELTLVEAEAIEAFRSEFKIDFDLSGTRRNVVTRGVPLNHLVGKEFWIGEVRARDLQLCEPCATLQRLSHPKVLPGLIHRGGLRAQILTEGMIRVGEAVKESAD